MWQLQCQKTVAQSSTKAEYMALLTASHQLAWIQSLLDEMSIKNLVPILYGDNMGSQFWAENPITEKQSKHVDVQYHFIRELVEEGRIALVHIKGIKNPADLPMKNLDVILFNRLLSSFGLTKGKALSKEE
jgi:hypothetical protein